ncbi:MAG: four helix bundle protein [Bacteroidota bacterium]
MATYSGFRDLIVFQKSYRLAMEIFEISKTFPKEEKILAYRSDQEIFETNTNQYS